MNMIHDRDPLFTEEFLGMLAGVGVKSVKLPPRSPNLNAHAERFVRSIKESCLDRMIWFGEGSLRKGISEFVTHYHGERNHQGLDNRLILPDESHAANRGRLLVPRAFGRHVELLLTRRSVNPGVNHVLTAADICTPAQAQRFQPTFLSASIREGVEWI